MVMADERVLLERAIRNGLNPSSPTRIRGRLALCVLNERTALQQEARRIAARRRHAAHMWLAALTTHHSAPEQEVRAFAFQCRTPRPLRPRVRIQPREWWKRALYRLGLLPANPPPAARRSRRYGRR